MRLEHRIDFEFSLRLDAAATIAFARDVETSLSEARFIEDLRVTPEPLLKHDLVQASIPINAAMFGQHQLCFQSLLIPTPQGARLQALPFTEPKTGWAEVAGEAIVSPLPYGSSLQYNFDARIHLQLPEPEKWGGRALLKMVEYTANRVLAGIVTGFPQAIEQAAKRVEAHQLG